MTAPAKCSRKTAAGRACRGKVIEGSNPPVCASHAGNVGRRTELFKKEAVADGKGGFVEVSLADRILGFLATGAQVKTVCTALGVGTSTYYEWIAKGEAEPGQYREFAEAAARAQSEGELQNIAVVKNAAAKDWRAAAWLLSKNNPDVYGRSAGKDENGGSQDPAPALPDDGLDPIARLEQSADELAPRRKARG